MIKKRIPTPKLTKEQVEEFGDGADGEMKSIHKIDESAKRDFKAINIPFNEYEFNQLEKGAKISSRTKLNFIRYAILKLTEELETK